MALDANLLRELRDYVGAEVTGPDGISDADLETCYKDTNRGNYNTYRTAYHVWRERLSSFVTRAFDFSKEGSLINRSQKTAYLERRVAEFRLRAGLPSDVGTHHTVLSTHQQQTTTSEFS